MSVFAPRFYNEPSFNGLFRLIDDFDKYASESSGDGQNGKLARQAGGSRLSLPTFTPKFDMKETETAYELHGDLPGIKKEDVHLEFTNDHTLRISGKVERSHTSGDKSLIEGNDKKEESAENKKEEEQQQQDKDKNKEVAKTSSDNEKQVSNDAPKVKYWVSERSVGEFARTFNFPTHVDADAISAKLDNGVLNVVVPKAKKPEGRRINIQ